MSNKRTIFTLSGWAQPHDSLHHIFNHEEYEDYNVRHLDYAEHTDTKNFIPYLADNIKADSIVVGWSLGGLLLMHAISENLINPAALVLFAAPTQFVRDDDFAHGMEEKIFSMFYNNYASNPQRTAKRFASLIAKGDSRATEISKHINDNNKDSDIADKWMSWLDVLNSNKAHMLNFVAMPSTLIIQGLQDNIVHHNQAIFIQENIEDSKMLILPEAGHAPHLHDSEECRNVIKLFLEQI